MPAKRFTTASAKDSTATLGCCYGGLPEKYDVLVFANGRMSSNKSGGRGISMVLIDADLVECIVDLATFQTSKRFSVHPSLN